MQSTFSLNCDELNLNFLNSLKAMFLGRKIEISVRDVDDETEYLLSTEANREHLLRSISQIESGAVHSVAQNKPRASSCL